MCQLHALLTELVPAGENRHLTSQKAAEALRKVTPGGIVELVRMLVAKELLADIRWLDRCIPTANQRLSQAVGPAEAPSMGGQHVRIRRAPSH